MNKRLLPIAVIGDHRTHISPSAAAQNTTSDRTERDPENRGFEGGVWRSVSQVCWTAGPSVHQLPRASQHARHA